VRAAALLLVGACSFQAGKAAILTGGDGPGPGSDAAGSDATGSGSDAAGSGSASWSMSLTITNNASGSLAAGFQVGFQVDLDAAPCAGDRSSVHVRRGGTDIVRSIDEIGTGNEWVWFPLQASIAAGAVSTEYTLTCLDPAGAAPSDATQVFDFVEPFNDLNAWSTRSSPTVSGGVVTLPQSDGMIMSSATYSSNHAVDFWLVVGDPTTNIVWGGWQDTTSDVRPWLIWYTVSNPNKIFPSFCDSTTNPCTNGPLAGAPLEPLDNQWHFYGVENCGNTTAVWRLGNAVIHTATIANYSGSHRLRLDNYNTAATVQGKGVRVRQAACPAPTTVVGTPTMM